MERFYELLDENNLINDENIRSEITSHWSSKRIIDFANSLNYEIMNCANRTQEHPLTDYSFTANSDLSSQHNSCQEITCRLKRIDDLARYATLYADHLFIRNYFLDYQNLSPNEIDNLDLRYMFTGDLQIMLKLKPLFTAQIISILPPFEPGIHICSDCAEKIIPGYRSYNKDIKILVRQLNKQYISRTTATISLLDISEKPLYAFTLRGAEDLWCSEGAIITTETLSPNLLSKLSTIPKSTLIKGIPLTKNDLAKTHLVESELSDSLEDIWAQRFATVFDINKVKYLTNRNIDLEFLKCFEKNPDFRNYTDVLQKQITYKLPILTEAPLEFLLDIRKNEFDSFKVFRDSINLILSEYILQHKELTTSDAKQIYLDLVQPRLNKLNQKAKSLANIRRRKAIIGTLVGGGILTFGVVSSFLTPEIRTAILAAGAAQGALGIDAIVQSSQTPAELRNDNLFFLWKASNY